MRGHYPCVDAIAKLHYVKGLTTPTTIEVACVIFLLTNRTLLSGLSIANVCLLINVKAMPFLFRFFARSRMNITHSGRDAGLRLQDTQGTPSLHEKVDGYHW